MSLEQLKPGPWQLRIWRSALTALASVALVLVAGLVIYAVAGVTAFLQPLLVPLVAAVILTYLLGPVVDRLCQWGLSRTWAVLVLFFAIIMAFSGIGLYVGPIVWHQTYEFGKTLPEQATRGQALALATLEKVRDFQQQLQSVTPLGAERSIREELYAAVAVHLENSIQWLQDRVPDILAAMGAFLMRSLGGFLGAAGVVLSLFLVPLFLFFFLRDSGKFAKTWERYIPLPESKLRDEVASLLSEINDYLVRYFRGQFTVSIIDGVLIGTALLIMGLNFAVLIGLAVSILALIPYVGLTICWIPAVLIAVAQFGDWTHPLIVTLIFVLMSNFESFFIAPRIVGESVSLHPLTVILSVLIWSLVLGVVLGALLAVPLTATIKVLLQRYVWRRRS